MTVTTVPSGTSEGYHLHKTGKIAAIMASQKSWRTENIVSSQWCIVSGLSALVQEWQTGTRHLHTGSDATSNRPAFQGPPISKACKSFLHLLLDFFLQNTCTFLLNPHVKLSIGIIPQKESWCPTQQTASHIKALPVCSVWSSRGVVSARS